MKRVSPRAGTGICLVVSLVFCAPSASAQAPSPPIASATAAPLSTALEGPAKQAYESAKLLATNRDFAGALAEFRHAHELSKDPRLLFNMAICEKELHHYARMRLFLEQYLREGATIATPESLTAAQDARTATKSLVAEVTLNVNEAGAEVIIDDELVGTTPLARPLVIDLGTHQISVKKTGFEPFQDTLETAGGTAATLSVSLRPQRQVGQLVVSAQDDATIVVDGSATGRGRFDGQLPAGEHELSVSAPGKRSYEVSLTLRDGETRTLQVALEDAPHGGSAWPWILGGVVVAAGATTGAYFLLKPHDQNSSANLPPGTFGTVRLLVAR
jgi:PEGA domain-containing protein